MLSIIAYSAKYNAIAINSEKVALSRSDLHDLFTQRSVSHAIRLLGYGIPNLDRALGNSNNRITLIARGERQIAARQAQIYEVSPTDGLRKRLGDRQIIRLAGVLLYCRRRT